MTVANYQAIYAGCTSGCNAKQNTALNGHVVQSKGRARKSI